jgi:hypothetical protein
MKKIRIGLFMLLFAATFQSATAQDVNINIDMVSPTVMVGDTTYMKVDICNVNATPVTAPSNKIKPLISTSGHAIVLGATSDTLGTPLTADWTVVSMGSGPGNSISVLRTTPLANTACVTFYLKMKVLAAGSAAFTCTLQWNGPQPIGNDPSNDNDVAYLTVTIPPNTNLTSGGTIAANQSVYCSYDPDNLTSVTAASGGSGVGTINYRWLANGNIISGAVSPTYDPGPVSLTTVYRREANRTGTTAWIASNDITVTITACDSPLTNGGTIAANQSAYGTYDPDNLTSVTAASGGSGVSTINYRWLANGNIISGAVSPTYDPGPVSLTTVYRREANRTGTTAWIASNDITITITGNASAQNTGTVYITSGSGSGGQLYRVDNPGTPSANPVAVGAPHTGYRALAYGQFLSTQLWAINSSDEIIAIAIGAYGNIYPSPLFSLASMGVSPGNYHSGDIGNYNGDLIYYILEKGGNQNLVKFNLSSYAFTQVSIHKDIPDIVFYNGFLYGAESNTGIIWKIDPNTGTSVSVGSPIPYVAGMAWGDGTGNIYFDGAGTYNANTNVTTLDPNVGSGGMIGGLSDDFDDAAWSPISQATPLTNGGTIAANQTACGTYDPTNLNSAAAPSGGSGNGTINFRWRANGNIISGAINPTYDPGPITSTTVYKREANRTGTTAWVASNDVTVTITSCNTNLTNGGTIAANQNGCGTFDPANLTTIAAPSGGMGSGSIQYRWRANGIIIPVATGATYDPGPITATTIYRRDANRTGSSLWVASNTVTVTVTACNSPLSSGQTIAPGQNNFDDASNITFYPNPVADQLQIKGLSAGQQLIVYNLLGQKMTEIKADRPEASVSFQQMKRGMYIVVVLNDGVRVSSEKIVKK